MRRLKGGPGAVARTRGGGGGGGGGVKTRKMTAAAKSAAPKTFAPGIGPPPASAPTPSTCGDE